MKITKNNKIQLSVEEVADLLNTTAQSINDWRMVSIDRPYLKPTYSYDTTDANIYFALSDIEEFIKELKKPFALQGGINYRYSNLCKLNLNKILNDIKKLKNKNGKHKDK